jgi:hypothetical protein
MPQWDLAYGISGYCDSGILRITHSGIQSAAKCGGAELKGIKCDYPNERIVLQKHQIESGVKVIINAETEKIMRFPQGLPIFEKIMHKGHYFRGCACN